MNYPLVTVICICYNHAEYVNEALQSVSQQTYPNIQLIVIDDFSTDQSLEVIKRFMKSHRINRLISLESNQGICKAFNQGLKYAKGEYIIDFSADDVMIPERIQKQVDAFQKLDDTYGIIYTNATLIDASSKPINTFYSTPNYIKKYPPPSGWVYKDLIRQHFICTPTMMVKKEVFINLGDYDESLVYEDYDFWVRSGKKYQYFFLDEILTQKRVLKTSLGHQFNSKRNNALLASTLKVCQKAFVINENQEENEALAISVRYHLRLSLLTENFQLAYQFHQLLKFLVKLSLKDQIIWLAVKWKIRLFGIYKVWKKWK